ncbi:Hypothetical protein NocV09_06200090 [Nannochloropsis oceanica]
MNTPSTAAVLYAARKKKGGSGAGEGFGQTQKKKEAARAPVPAPSAPAGGEEVKEKGSEDAKTAAKENFKAKLMEVGSSLQNLASQVDARAGDGEDPYDPAFVAEQKRLRAEIDFDRPYARERPRNWDYITGLPVPKIVRIEDMIPIPAPSIREQYRELRPNDPAYMAQRIKDLFVPGADLEELRSWYIANRDWLGQGTRLILAAKSLRCTWLKDYAESKTWLDSLRVYRTVEVSVTCHLQQGMREAEFRLSQNLGNLNILTVGGNTPAEKACMWITLKAVLAKWETRRERQLKVPPEERTPAQDRALAGTRKVVDLFQKMNVAFSEEESGTLCEICRALALGTAEFETEAPLELVKALLPDDINDPNAGYPFRVDYRLDAAQEVKRVSAQNAGEKIDVYLKALGIPFPESTKRQLEPRKEGTERCRATDEGRNLGSNPVLEWNEAEAEKTPEEKEAAAAALAAAREKGLDSFREKWQVWVPGEEGREEGGKVVSVEEARKRWGEEEATRALGDPRTLLKKVTEENERWAARVASGGGGGGRRRR